MTLAREFFRDMTDKSAERAATPNWGVESLTTIGVFLLAASAQAEAIRKLVGELVGDFSNAVQLMLLLGAILWCAAIISGKAQAPSAPLPQTDPTPASRKYVYTYSQFLRILAKVGLAGSVVFVPFRLAALADELILLPDTIYGVIYKGADQRVDSARLRLVSSSGEDITSGDWRTDSRGFYRAQAIRRLRRSDSIRVVPEGCKSERSLPLTRVYEAPPGALQSDSKMNGLSPRFIHHVNCEDQ